MLEVCLETFLICRTSKQSYIWSRLTRNSDSAVLNKSNALNDAKIKNNSTEWIVPQYTPDVKQQSILMNQNVNNVPTELHYVERSVFMQEVKNQKYGSFTLGLKKV